MLLLLEGVDVGGKEILVHEHAVAQVLITGHGIHLPGVGLVLQVQSSVEKTAAVTSLMIGTDLPHEFGVGLLSLELPRVEVGVGMLIAVVIAYRGIQGETVVGTQDASQASPTRLHAVGLLARVCVIEIAAAALVVTTGREGEAVAEAVIVREGGVAVKVGGGNAQLEVGAFVAEGITRLHLDDTAHGVAAIEGTLGPPEDVDALYAVEVEVEG